MADVEDVDEDEYLTNDARAVAATGRARGRSEAIVPQLRKKERSRDALLCYCEMNQPLRRDKRLRLYCKTAEVGCAGWRRREGSS